MIDWLALIIVAVATLVSALIAVTLYAAGVRLRAVATDAEEAGEPNVFARVGAWALFLLCLCVVVLGVYLIVPALHG